MKNETPTEALVRGINEMKNSVPPEVYCEKEFLDRVHTRQLHAGDIALFCDVRSAKKLEKEIILKDIDDDTVLDQKNQT